MDKLFHHENLHVEHFSILMEYGGQVNTIHHALIAVLLFAQVVIGVLYTLMFSHIYQHNQNMAKMLTQVQMRAILRNMSSLEKVLCLIHTISQSSSC